MVLAALFLGALGVTAGPDDDAKCTMTDMGGGNGLYNIEMHSVHPIAPYKEIHCRFQSQDPLVTFKGSDASGQCDNCVKSSGESITCGCTCPAGGSPCSYSFTGTVQFEPHHYPNSTHAYSCVCNGKGPPTPPKPPPPPPKPPPPPPKPPPPPPKPPPKVCKAKLDIVVVLDGSASITTTDWYSVRDFTVQIVDAFNVSADGAMIGAVQFSSTDPLFPVFGKPAHTIIGLSSDAAKIKAAVSKERQMNKDTNTYAGFDLAKTMLETSGRSDSKGKLVILLTDGEQNEGKPAIDVADALKQEKVEIFGIGVGNQISKGTMETWVSTPTSKHYFPVTAFSELNKVLQQIVTNACPHPSPPPPMI